MAFRQKSLHKTCRVAASLNNGINSIEAFNIVDEPHAEEQVIERGKYIFAPQEPLTLVITHPPCIDCAKLIMDKKSKVCAVKVIFGGHWGEFTKKYMWKGLLGFLYLKFYCGMSYKLVRPV